MIRPNIVFVMADDHAAHAISAYGSRVNRTPHLDRLAREGMRLDALYCTNSICSPSRASILTGTYSHVNGVSSISTEIDYRVPTFVDVLHEQGYRTGLFGKWHLGEHDLSLPRGFDAWRVFPDQGDYVDPTMLDEHGPRWCRATPPTSSPTCPSTGSTACRPTSRSACSCTTRRRTARGSPTRVTGTSTPTGRSPSRTRSSTTTPPAARRCAESTCPSPTTWGERT